MMNRKNKPLRWRSFKLMQPSKLRSGIPGISREIISTRTDKSSFLPVSACKVSRTVRASMQ